MTYMLRIAERSAVLSSRRATLIVVCTGVSLINAGYLRLQISSMVI